MTTAESIACTILNCHIGDLEFMFDVMVKSGLFYDAVHKIIDNSEDITPCNIFENAMSIAIDRVFGNEYQDNFEVDSNYLAAGITFLGNEDSIINFDEKVLKFCELTGFDPSC